MSPEHARLWALVLAQQDVIGVVLRRLGVPEADLAELAQECLLEAWQLIAAGKLVIGADIRRPDIAVRVWLALVARWLALPWLRSTRRRRRSEVVEVEAEAPGDLGARVEARELVRRLVGLCSRQERAILAETVEGATHDEIGKKLGMPAGSVATKLRYIRRHLQKHRR